VRRRWGKFTGTLPNETGVLVEVEVLVAGELVYWVAYYLGSVVQLALVDSVRQSIV
jgi:hypothetical protein